MRRMTGCTLAHTATTSGHGRLGLAGLMLRTKRKLRDPVSVALKTICTHGRSVYPFGSEYTKLNVPLDPLPDDGVTDTAAGAWFGALVQFPRCCQPVASPPMSWVCM